MLQPAGALTRNRKQRLQEQLRLMNQELAQNPEMAQEIRERLDEIEHNFRTQRQNLDDHETALGNRLNDATRLTDAVRAINDRQHVVEPQNRTSFTQLEPFRGRLGDDFSQWIRRFEDVALECNWTDARRLQILPALLVDNAHEIYHAIPVADRPTYNALKTLLTERLQPAENRHFKATELHARKQGSYESVDDYSSAVQRLARGAYSTYPDDTRAQLLLDAFLTGLKPQLRQLVTLSNPDTFPAALATARRLEAQNALTVNSAASDSVSALLQVLPALTSTVSASSNQNDRGRSENRRDNRYREIAAESLQPTACLEKWIRFDAMSAAWETSIRACKRQWATGLSLSTFTICANIISC